MILETDNSAENSYRRWTSKWRTNKWRTNHEENEQALNYTVEREKLTENNLVEEQNLSLGEQQTEKKLKNKIMFLILNKTTTRKVSDDITNNIKKSLNNNLIKTRNQIDGYCWNDKSRFGNRVQNEMDRNVARQISGIEIIKK